MAPKEASEDHKGTPDPVERGFATFATLRFVIYGSSNGAIERDT